MIKQAHDIMLSSGLLTHFTVSDLANMTKGTMDVGAGFMDAAYQQREGIFRESGETVGELIGTGAMALANLDFMRHTGQIHGKFNTFVAGGNHSTGLGAWSNWAKPTEAKAILGKSGTGTVWDALEGGGYKKAGNIIEGKFNPINNGKEIGADSPFGKVLSKKGKGGFLRHYKDGSRGWVPGQSAKRGILPFVGAFAVGWAAKGILGFAGGVLDEAMRDYHRERRVHYDNRFFNTQRDEMSNYQALGSAMNNYESRYQSTARIYHSR